VIVGATVTLESAESKAARTVVADAHGEYRFLLLSPSAYTLTVTANGFARYEQRGLQLLVNTPATVIVQLKLPDNLRPTTRAWATVTTSPASALPHL